MMDINAIETWFVNKERYESNFILNIIKLITTHGLGPINISPSQLDTIHELEVVPEAYVTIDYPYSLYDTGGRLALINHYYNLLKNKILGFNIGPIYHRDDKVLANDLSSIGKAAKQMKLPVRLVLELRHQVSDAASISLANIAEQSGIDAILCGTFSYKETSFIDRLISGNQIMTNCSIPVSFYGNFDNQDYLDKVQNCKFKSLILKPKNILQFFE